VVIVLPDQFNQLLFGVGGQGGGGGRAVVGNLVDRRNLRPHDHAAPAGFVVAALIVLVMGQAHRVGAEVLHQIEIALLVGASHGPAFARQVLVQRHAVQGDMFAVEEKALAGVEGDAAQAQRQHHLVQRFAARCPA
jgi:hypothetical protein